MPGGGARIGQVKGAEAGQAVKAGALGVQPQRRIRAVQHANDAGRSGLAWLRRATPPSQCRVRTAQRAGRLACPVQAGSVVARICRAQHPETTRLRRLGVVAVAVRRQRHGAHALMRRQRGDAVDKFTGAGG